MKEDVCLLYICCFVELNQEKNDLVKNFLQNVVLYFMMFFVVVLGVIGRVVLSLGMFFVDVVVQGVVKVVMSGLVEGGVKVVG